MDKEEIKNPQAFPSMEIDYKASAAQLRTVYHDQVLGMDLRDYFAAKALQSLVRDFDMKKVKEYGAKAASESMDAIGALSYMFADAMLKQRLR